MLLGQTNASSSSIDPNLYNSSWGTAEGYAVRDESNGYDGVRLYVLLIM